MKIFKTILFWVISCTWGSIMTLLGLLVSLGLIIGGSRPKKFGYGFYFEVGKNWGGLEMGPVFLVQENASINLKQHEAGHGIQNIWFGPLMPFLVSIPSAIRYWLREYGIKKDQTSKYRWVFRLISIPMVLSFILIIIGSFTKITSFGMFNFVLGICLFIYLLSLLVWLVEFEVPKYSLEIPHYDDIWFEGLATKLGQERWPEPTKLLHKLNID